MSNFTPQTKWEIAVGAGQPKREPYGSFRIDFRDFMTGRDNITILFLSDSHRDSPHACRDDEREHLEWARRNNALVFHLGDLFDAMQGFHDRRRTRGADRDYSYTAYLDELVEDHAKFYAQYADIMPIIGTGNHETNVLKHGDTDLTRRLIERLREKTGNPWPLYGGYRWACVIAARAPNKGTHGTILIDAHHGYGGGGVMTGTRLKVKRHAAVCPDADVIVQGHTHGMEQHRQARRRVNRRDGTITEDTQRHLTLGGYKDTSREAMGWEVEKGFAPQVLGSYAIRYRWSGFRSRVRCEQLIELPCGEPPPPDLD